LPTHKSAAKRLRQERVRYQRNKARKSQLKTAIKKVLKEIEAKNITGAQEALKQAIPVIDKMCSKGLIHKNNAARKKSRLTRKVNALAEA